MSDERWIVVPSWEKFQHYKDRNPVWIKLYIELAHKDEWLRLTGPQRGMLVTVWLEYALSKGRVSREMIRRSLGESFRNATLESLNDAGFIQFVASKPLAHRYQAASPEKEGEVLRTSPKDALAREPEGAGSRERAADKNGLHHQLFVEAQKIAADWTGQDSLAFDERLDELENDYGVHLTFGERDRLWQTAFHIHQGGPA